MSSFALQNIANC